MEACPQERTNRSRPIQSGFAGLYRRYFVHSRYDSGASPIGVPGCPDFAFWTASTDRNRMALIARISSALFSKSLFLLRFGLLTLLRLELLVRPDLELHAPVRLSPLGRPVVGDGIGLAIAMDGEPRRGHAAGSDQIAHSRGTPLAELLVVFRAPRGVGVPLHRDVGVGILDKNLRRLSDLVARRRLHLILVHVEQDPRGERDIQLVPLAGDRRVGELPLHLRRLPVHVVADPASHRRPRDPADERPRPAVTPARDQHPRAGAHRAARQRADRRALVLRRPVGIRGAPRRQNKGYRTAQPHGPRVSTKVRTFSDHERSLLPAMSIDGYRDCDGSSYHRRSPPSPPRPALFRGQVPGPRSLPVSPAREATRPRRYRAAPPPRGGRSRRGRAPTSPFTSWRPRRPAPARAPP